MTGHERRTRRNLDRIWNRGFSSGQRYFRTSDRLFHGVTDHRSRKRFLDHLKEMKSFGSQIESRLDSIPRDRMIGASLPLDRISSATSRPFPSVRL